MADNNLRLTEDIIAKLGGKNNIQSATNCMTRWRVNIKDTGKIDKNGLEKIEGVMGCRLEGNQVQVVLGPGKAKKVADIGLEKFGIKTTVEEADWQTTKQDVKSHQKSSKLRNALQMIANIFVPLIPAVIAGGLFNGLGSLFAQLIADGVLPESWQTVQLMTSLIGSGFMGYFAIYTGYRAAEEFGATPGFGGMIGGISVGANVVEISKILGLYNETVPLESILTTGKGGIIGVIFGVWLLAKLEKWLHKVIPDSLDLVATPLLTMGIMGTAYVFIIMPVAGVVSDFIVSALSVIIASPNRVVRIISGYLLSALFLPLVLLGLHHGLIPIYAVQLEQMGGVTLFPVLAMAGAGQVGAALAIYQIAKRVENENLQKVIRGALPAGFLGVGEPLIYGVTLPMGKPFITAGLGAGFGGAFVMLMGVTASAWGPSGLVAIPLMQGVNKMIYYFVGLVISYIAGYIITRLVIKDEDVIALKK